MNQWNYCLGRLLLKVPQCTQKQVALLSGYDIIIHASKEICPTLRLPKYLIP